MEVTVHNVKNLNFSKEDVIITKERKAIRSYNLKRALALGNLYKRKVKIYFKTLEGIVKKIDTTVWAVGEEFISLKSGASLPIRSVEKIEF